VRHFDADVGIIVGGVAYVQRPVLGVLDVLLGIAHGRLDKGRGLGVGLVGGHLVAGEEADDVLVLGELVHHVLVPLEQPNVPEGIVRLDGEARLRQVRDDVDARLFEQAHALRVVGRRVDGVGADHVGAQLLEQGDVLPAPWRIRERVDVFDGFARAAACACVLLVGDALDVELGAILVEELGALDVDGGESQRLADQGRGRENLGEHHLE
jgi:hypothetical protein